MKLTLTRKLLLVLLISNLLLLAVMGLATRARLESGLNDYLADEELQGLLPLAGRIVDAYRMAGGWEFLRNQPGTWPRLLGERDTRFRPPPPHGYPGAMPTDFGEPMFGPPGRGLGGPPGFQRPPPGVAPGGWSEFAAPPADTGASLPSQGKNLLGRLRLLDADLQHLNGPPEPFSKPIRMPLDMDGEIIGWLSLQPLPWPVHGMAKRFFDDVSGAMIWIALASLLLALAFALPMGRHLLRPVRALTRGTHALTAGEFNQRIAVEGNDELGALAHDFNQLAEALERNERLRRQAMADVSHELRTPLAVLRAEIEAIQDGVRPCDGERIGSLHRSVLGMSHLVNDLYELALSDVGALTYHKREMNLTDLVAAALSASEGRITDSGLELESEIGDELAVFGDPERLRQVVDNLLSNALRYTDAGGSVLLRAYRDGQWIALDVMDSAPGVEAQRLERLFERFYRVEASRNRARGGAGLGLAICRNIVEAHGGRITAHPSPRGGVWVALRLPAAGQ